jgi:hypothetical protein
VEATPAGADVSATRDQASMALLRFWIFLPALLLGAAANAQDLEPRAYSNAPVGLNFLIAGYGYAEGELTTYLSRNGYGGPTT